jgi:tRNA nucleotidyltransferase (CCA-adding enzyme)
MGASSGFAFTNKNGSPGLGAAVCKLKHAYPDQRLSIKRGSGDGLSNMPDIIHDFLRYNDRVAPNLAVSLTQALSAEDKERIELVRREAAAMGLAVYIVGGLPRDVLLGRRPTDFDLVVDGSAPDLARALAAKHGGKVTVHSKFGTAKWTMGQGDGRGGEVQGDGVFPETSLDLISSRSEVYPRPAQLPQVRRGTIEDDLRRRDFTVNALAIRIDGPHFGMLLDPLGAMADLESRRIRVLHARSFVDDPTRMYRAVRYEQRLGFEIAPETRDLVLGALGSIGLLSAHRLRQEFDQVLGEASAGAILRRLAELGLLKAAHTALPRDEAAIARVQNAETSRPGLPRSPSMRELRTRRWVLWLMGLPAGEIRSVNGRLHFDKRLTTEILAASELRRSLKQISGLRPSRLTERLGRFPLGSVEAVCDGLRPSAARRQLELYLTTWRHIRPRTTGHVLKDMGIAPGPVYRKVLEQLRNGWIDGTIRSPAQERNELDKALKATRSRRRRPPPAAPSRVKGRVR